jgi:hypothetical protein
VQEILSSADQLAPDLKVLLRHYKDLVETEFMGAQKETGLAWEVHRKFAKAVAFLSANDPQTQLRREIRRLIDEASTELGLNHDQKQEIGFILAEWRNDPRVYDPKEGGLLFWFDDFRTELILSLGVNPKTRAIADKLMSVVKADTRLFRPESVGTVRGGWPTVWSRRFLKSTDLETFSRDQAFDQITRRWIAFLDKDMRELRAFVTKTMR